MSNGSCGTHAGCPLAAGYKYSNLCPASLIHYCIRLSSALILRSDTLVAIASGLSDRCCHSHAPWSRGRQASLRRTYPLSPTRNPLVPHPKAAWSPACLQEVPIEQSMSAFPLCKQLRPVPTFMDEGRRCRHTSLAAPPALPGKHCYFTTPVYAYMSLLVHTRSCPLASSVPPPHSRGSAVGRLG